MAEPPHEVLDGRAGSGGQGVASVPEVVKPEAGHRAGSRPRSAHRSRRNPSPGRRPARSHRPRRPGHPPARPAAPLQRPHRQMLHLPLPGTRPQPVPATSNQHHHRHHLAHPAAPRHRRTRPQPQQIHPATAAPAAHPPPASHRPHHQPPAPRLDRNRTRRPPRHPVPQRALPARRMGTLRLLHPHRLRHLPAQHAAGTRILDKRPRSLTTRHCYAMACGPPLTEPGRESPDVGSYRGWLACEAGTYNLQMPTS
jgi:hypothetical protein